MHLLSFFLWFVIEGRKLICKRKSLENLARMARLYPSPWWSKYAIFSIIVPSALLFHKTNASFDLGRTLPLISVLFLGYTFTFFLNSLTDIKEDRFKPMPVLTSKAGLKKAKLLCGVIVLIQISLAAAIFNPLTFILFLILQVSSVLYSWGARFKESILGPLIGSMFYWGPIPLIAVHMGGINTIEIWKAFPPSLGLYLICMIFLGMEKELSHNIFDFDVDNKAGVRTFGQIAGKKNTKTLIKIFKCLYLLSMIILGYFISQLAFITSIIFLLLGVAGLFQSKYYFTILAVICLLSGNMGYIEVFLLFVSIPFFVKFFVHFLHRSEAGIHSIRAAINSTVDHVHSRHRILVFSKLEKIK